MSVYDDLNKNKNPYNPQDPRYRAWQTPAPSAKRANATSMFRDPKYRKRMEAYGKNPFNINSKNPAEVAKAEQFYQNAEKSLLEGRPGLPTWQGLAGQNGILEKQFQMKAPTVSGGSVDFQNLSPEAEQRFSNINLNKDALNAIRSQALSTGPSAWLNLQLQNQGQNELQNLDTAAAQAAGANATAESNLAARGGIGTGARERLARGSAWDQMRAMQDVRRGGTQDRLNLGIADEENRQNLLKALPGMELQALQPEMEKAQFLSNYAQGQQDRGLDTQRFNIGTNLDTQKFNAGNNMDTQKYNIGNALNEAFQKRAFDSNQYNEQMRAWAAGKTADNMGGGKK